MGFSCLSFGLLGFGLNGFELVANNCLGVGFKFRFDGSSVKEGVLGLSFGLLSSGAELHGPPKFFFFFSYNYTSNRI